MKIAGASVLFDWITPMACQGSMEPWTNTTLLTAMSRPPYSVLVDW